MHFKAIFMLASWVILEFIGMSNVAIYLYQKFVTHVYEDLFLNWRFFFVFHLLKVTGGTVAN